MAKMVTGGCFLKVREAVLYFAVYDQIKGSSVFILVPKISKTV